MKKLNRFATDLSMRCNAEFENVHRKTAVDTEKLQGCISTITDAILECYKGNHKLCKAHSTVCKGENDENWFVDNEYLTYFFKLKMKPGCEKTVRDCINYRLGPIIVELTKLNSNSQKIESLNNIYKAFIAQKCHIFSKFSGRAHSAVFKCNNGPGESLLRLCEASGCPIACYSKVSAGLLAEQKKFF